MSPCLIMRASHPYEPLTLRPKALSPRSNSIFNTLSRSFSLLQLIEAEYSAAGAQEVHKLVKAELAAQAARHRAALGARESEFRRALGAKDPAGLMGVLEIKEEECRGRLADQEAEHRRELKAKEADLSKVLEEQAADHERALEAKDADLVKALEGQAACHKRMLARFREEQEENNSISTDEHKRELREQEAVYVAIISALSNGECDTKCLLDSKDAECRRVLEEREAECKRRLEDQEADHRRALKAQEEGFVAIITALSDKPVRPDSACSCQCVLAMGGKREQQEERGRCQWEQQGVQYTA